MTDFADQAMQILQDHNYVFLRCANLHNEVIAVIKDFHQENQPILDLVHTAAQRMIEKGKFTEQPPIYTVSEMKVVANSSRALVIHEAKKLGGIITNAKVLLEEEN